ncbi:MAG: PucR family transcriptional regulator [Pyramidobacter sp.]
MPEFKGLRLLAGSGGLGREVLRTTVGDAPDCYKWSQGGEFVITSGYPFRDLENVEQLIRGCRECGTAALGIKLGRYIESLAPQTLALADKIDFPLISIPLEMPFAEILHPVQSRVISDQAHLLRYSSTVQKVFFDLNVHCANLEDLLETLRNFTHLNLALRCTESSFDRLCANEGPFREALASLPLPEVLRRYPWEKIVLCGESISAWLIFDAKPSQLHEPWNEIPITQAKGALLLFFQRWSSGAQVERRYRNEFVMDILMNNLRLKDEVWNRAHAFGWDLAGAKRVVVCDIDDYKNRLTCAMAAGQGPGVLEGAKGRIFAICREFIGRVEKHVPYAEMSDLATFILSSQGIFEEEQRQLERVLTPMMEQITAQTGFSVTVGVSGRCGDVFLCWKGYDQARTALEMVRHAWGGGRVVWWNRMGATRALSVAMRDPTAQEFVEAQLGSLIRFDGAKKNDTLLRTLETMVACNWSMKRSAAALGIHYNTLKYRWEKICSLLSEDFSCSESRFCIELALRLKQMDNINNKGLSD